MSKVRLQRPDVNDYDRYILTIGGEVPLLIHITDRNTLIDLYGEMGQSDETQDTFTFEIEGNTYTFDNWTVGGLYELLGKWVWNYADTVDSRRPVPIAV